jgi:CBS domain-containing protein
MLVREIVSEPVETVPSSMSLDEATTLMHEHRFHHLVVKQAGQIVGVLSGSGVKESVPPVGSDRTVSDVMGLNVAIIDENATVRRAANLMQGRSIGCLAVTCRGKLTGIVTISDLPRLLGKGGDRAAASRASLHFRLPHRKQPNRRNW